MTNIRLDSDDRLWILDQSLLPNTEKELQLKSLDDMYDAILTLKVRGAPAIGICAAYSIYVLAKSIAELNESEFWNRFLYFCNKLSTARPTAVNLTWAINEMRNTAETHITQPRTELLQALREKAVAIHSDDIDMCRKISEYGLELIKDGWSILTHCNAGPLATSKYGTALGPILLGKERGFNFRVFADETRPLLQGARLTAYELHRAGVDVTLICDNMASIVMKNGWIQACFVGCDRVARNGDTANKIGTSCVAILAKHYGIPFYVLGPSSSIDLSCSTGDDIKIELRPEDEIKTKFYTQPMAPEAVKCYNPAFDVTDHSLITAIITESGILRPPFDRSIVSAFEK